MRVKSKSLPFFGLGPILLAVAGAESQISKLVIAPDWLFEAIAALGVASLAIGLVIVIIQNIPAAAQITYISRPVRLSEVDEAYDFIVSIFGSDVAPKSLVRAWIQKNPTVLYLVEKRTSTTFTKTIRRVGFFSVFPLTKHASDLMLNNTIFGTALLPDLFVEEGAAFDTVYIGAIGALDQKSRGKTLEQLIGNVTAAVGTKNTKLISRPATPDGSRLLKKFGFSPTGSDSDGNLQNHILEISPAND